MIFSDGISALQSVIDRRESFGDWALRNIHLFFSPREDFEYDLNDIIHLFMKRLGQPVDQVMRMDLDRRDAIFLREKAILDKENEQAKDNE